MQKRNVMRNNTITTNPELTEINKEVSKAIRHDIRIYHSKNFQQSIEYNKSMRVICRRLNEEKSEIIKQP